MHTQTILIVFAILVIFLIVCFSESSLREDSVQAEIRAEPEFPESTESFRLRRTFNLPAQQRYMRQFVRQNQQFNPIARAVQANLQGRRALTTPGIVPGSAIANLQRQYVKIFSPRAPGQISGQQQRYQHLYGGPSGRGLGLTGWNYSMSGLPGYSSSIFRPRP